MAEEKAKRPAAHETAIKLLWDGPTIHVNTLARMYALGTVVPAEAIPELIAAFEEARIMAPLRESINPDIIDKAIYELREQLLEAQQKEDERSSDTTVADNKEELC